ncbi:bromodomain-containing protein, putative [Ricinus communis]|uniref:Bromodomain-containing protein, putative n=1 Tax=Ricinus communis TaxID=3988 RepID=B9S1A3_RICCO|nr:bromodomain-containing protein, putative [Ricinus communis]|eukprot:XP_002519772.1 transcription factor GTE12 isoform X1 [Ricinus communis]
MISTEPVVAKKLKIKFSSHKIDTISVKNACDMARNVEKNYHSQVCDIENMKQKLTECSAIKRGPSDMVEGQQQKKRKMDRGVIHQCTSLVKSLMNHPCGWVFKEPVDPEKLEIPDYFSVITNPMDLGTVKSKLENNQYFGAEEFAADVRLTFSNALLYNPPLNYVHKMAEKLKKIFETRWKALEEKWNYQIAKDGDGKPFNARPKEVGDTRQKCPQTPPLHKAELPKRSKPSEVKLLRGSSNVRAAEVKLSKPAENCNSEELRQNSYKGTDNGGRNACGSVNVKPSSVSVVSKCGTCGRSACQCILPSDSAQASSDISSEKSWGKDHHACSTDTSKMDVQGKCMSMLQMSKSDPDSDGAVSALDEENICPSSQLMTPATDANSVEGWRPPIFDVQLSPTKALRAAMLKRRFADTILKAQHKTLLDHGDKADPVKLQEEKERLEKRQLEEKARIEAQIRAAEAASRKREEIELRKQREKEREAARVALQKMEKTAEIEQNLEIVKELEKLSGCSLSYSYSFGRRGPEIAEGDVGGAHSCSLLERLGLIMKDDTVDDDEILIGDEEEGEIFP